MRPVVGALGLMVLVWTGACSVAGSAVPEEGKANSAASSAVAIGPPSPLASIAPYRHAVDVAHAGGLEVWLEADLVERWLEGRASFEAGVRRLATLARRPGVIGFKIADELGYRDGIGNDPAGIQRFLDDAARALHAASPKRLLLADLLVPELGCAPGLARSVVFSSACRTHALAQYPGLSEARVNGYLASGDLDVVDVSTDLLSDSAYRRWGIDMQTAQTAAWTEIRRLGWPSLVRVQARKALAHPGSYGLDAGEAESALRTYIDIPTDRGAAAVDVWTWRQTYQGKVVRLADPGNRPNALWDALLERRRAGVSLFTHFTPSSVERGVNSDLAMAARVFTAVFIAAGTG